jgi:hypothetical protein
MMSDRGSRLWRDGFCVLWGNRRCRLSRSPSRAPSSSAPLCTPRRTSVLASITGSSSLVRELAVTLSSVGKSTECWVLDLFRHFPGRDAVLRGSGHVHLDAGAECRDR